LVCEAYEERAESWWGELEEMDRDGTYYTMLILEIQGK
jgi:hypothetical protein